MQRMKSLIRLEIQRQLASYRKKGKFLEVVLYILTLFSAFWIGLMVLFLGLTADKISSNSSQVEVNMKSIIESGVGFKALNLQTSLLFFLSFIIGIFIVKMVFFNKYDQNILWPLPIKKKEILLSKFIGTLLPYLLPIFLFTLSGLVLSYNIRPNIFYLLLLLIENYLLVGFGLSLGMMIGLVFLRILHQDSMPKWAKSLLGLLAMSIFLFLYFLEVSKNFSGVISLLGYSSKYLIFLSPHSSQVKSSLLSFLLLLFFTIGANLLLFVLLDKYYFSFFERQGKEKKEAFLKDQDYKIRNAFVSLLQKEISLYWSNSAIVANTFVSVFFLLFVAGAALVPSLQEKFLSFSLSLGFFTKDTLLFFVLLFLAGTMNISTYNFSLEGKMAYNTYSLPLSGQKIFLAKLCASLVQILPVYLLSFLLLALSIKPSLNYLPLLFFGPLAYIIFNNTLGLFFDLKFANYLWDDPKQLAKQSKQAFFTGFGNLLLSFIILGIGYQILDSYPYLFTLLVTLLLWIAIGIFYLLLKEIRVYHI